MCCMQALVVSVACVVDCRRSSCRSVSLAVKGWRCQVNEKIVGTRSNAQCPRAMHVCGGADWCSPMSTSFLGRVRSLRWKVCVAVTATITTSPPLTPAVLDAGTRG